MCFLYTPNRRLSHFSAVRSASLSRAPTTVLLCLLPSCRCSPAMKRGRDNAGVGEISPRFHPPRHRFEGSTEGLECRSFTHPRVSSFFYGRDEFFFFPSHAANFFFFSRPVDKNIAKHRERTRESSINLLRLRSLNLNRESYFSRLSANARISADG